MLAGPVFAVLLVAAKRPMAQRASRTDFPPAAAYVDVVRRRGGPVPLPAEYIHTATHVGVGDVLIVAGRRWGRHRGHLRGVEGVPRAAVPPCRRPVAVARDSRGHLRL